MPFATRPTRACLLIAVVVAAVGLCLRLAVPVTPVDAAFRDVLHAYAGAPSNTGETSPP